MSHEYNLGGYEYHLGGYESHLGCYEFLEVWCWLKIGLDQTGPIREGLGASHVTVGRHTRGITDREKLISQSKSCIDAANALNKKFRNLEAEVKWPE